MRRGTQTVVFLLLALSIAAVGQGQVGPQLQPSPVIPTYTESAGTEYVLLPAQVLDRKGRFVDGLEKKDFSVRVEGIPVEIDTFERDEDAPVSFAFLIDTSGSMHLAEKLEHAKGAVRTLIEQRRAGDDFALFAFAEGEVRTLSNFSTDPRPLLRELNRLEAGGQTALFDAVAATTSKMLEGKNGKRAILLFTDGVDNASVLSPVQMAEILQQVSIPVYAIGMKNTAFDRLTEEERRDLALDNLKLLANSSGGMMLLAGGEEDLRPTAAKISADVRKQYLLGFSPSGRGDSKYRIIVVSVVRPGNWVIRARRGYKGSAPAPVAGTGPRSSG
ncbi:MAG TPA: VWA domain-containing protein [Thermoanaerobaculia bacterium]